VNRVLVGLFGGPDGNFLYFDDCDLDTFLAVKKLVILPAEIATLVTVL